MAELHHFAYGWLNPVVSYSLAFLGSLLGLFYTARATATGARGRGAGRRMRWLGLAAVAIGGAGVWLMHLMAMLGFDVPGSDVRHDPLRTSASLVIAVGTIGAGLLIVGTGRRRTYKILLGGLFTGGGMAAMHYTGVDAMRVAGRVDYAGDLVGLSVLVAVVASTAALWVTVDRRGWRRLVTGAACLSVAVVGMHYTGMAALRVWLDPNVATVHGLTPVLLVVPITILAAAALLAMAFSALQAMTEEEFGAPSPDRPALSPDRPAPSPDRPAIGPPDPAQRQHLSTGRIEATPSRRSVSAP